MLSLGGTILVFSNTVGVFLATKNFFYLEHITKTTMLNFVHSGDGIRNIFSPLVGLKRSFVGILFIKRACGQQVSKTESKLHLI